MRCPACHEENLDDALVCERCQAVLKKLAPSGEIRALTKDELDFQVAAKSPSRTNIPVAVAVETTVRKKTLPGLAGPATRRPTPVVPVAVRPRKTPIVAMPSARHATPIVPVPANPAVVPVPGPLSDGKTPSRGRLLVLTGIAAVLAGVLVYRWFSGTAPAPATQVAHTRHTLTFIGPDGTDGDGYPRATVSRPPLIALLATQDFPPLDALLAPLVAAAHADPRNEYQITDAFEAFAISPPSVHQAVVNWQAAMPTGTAANTARGVNLVAQMQARTGGRPLAELPDEYRNQLTIDAGRAKVALETALTAAPDLVPAWIYRLRLATILEAPLAERQALAARALANAPGSYLVRATILEHLRPDVGGSHDAMAAFAESSQGAGKNPRMRRLVGFAAWDRCVSAAMRGAFSDARVACDEALAAGPDPRFLFARARVLRAQDAITDALVDYQAVLDARPEDLPTLLDRIDLFLNRKLWARAAADIALAKTLDPTHPELERLSLQAQNALVLEGRAHERGQRFDEAAAAYDQALAIAPTFAAARIRKDRLAKLHASLREAEASPRDFDAQDRVATLYTHDGRFEDALLIWNDFLARKPKHPQALAARARAFFALDKIPEAIQDAHAACALGLAMACDEKKQYEGKTE